MPSLPSFASFGAGLPPLHEPPVVAALVMGLGYLAASLNFPVVLCALGAIPDPRRAHSGNPGVSNVYRTAGPRWAAVVLLLDVGRAAGLAALSLAWLPPAWVPLGALGLVAGNRWPLFHGFRGGKGVANYLGFTLLAAPWGAAAAAAAWVATYGLLRQVFVASFAMVLALGVGTVITYGPSAPALAASVVVVALIVHAHRGNFAAWRRGTRPP